MSASVSASSMMEGNFENKEAKKHITISYTVECWGHSTTTLYEPTSWVTLPTRMRHVRFEYVSTIEIALCVDVAIGAKLRVREKETEDSKIKRSSEVAQKT